jgi:Bacterial membrane protein YfhO
VQLARARGAHVIATVDRDADEAAQLGAVDHAEEVEVDATAQRSGYLILDDSFYPGWQATVDGHPARILPANENFRAVAIPAGRDVIAFRYRPASFFVGAAISLATALVMISCGLFWWARGRRQRAPQASSAPIENESMDSPQPSSLA